MNRPWTPADIRTLIEMRHRGCSFNEIGRAIGRCPKSVSWYATTRLRIVNKKKFEELKASLQPDHSNGPRPVLQDFVKASWEGVENRGWGRFLDDEQPRPNQKRRADGGHRSEKRHRRRAHSGRRN